MTHDDEEPRFKRNPGSKVTPLDATKNYPVKSEMRVRVLEVQCGEKFKRFSALVTIQVLQVSIDGRNRLLLPPYTKIAINHQSVLKPQSTLTLTKVKV